jgi:hypothetical protein
MIRFVMKPAMAPRTIHAMMPMMAFLHWKRIGDERRTASVLG